MAVTHFYNWIPLFLFLIALIFIKYQKKDGLTILLAYTVMLLLLGLFIFFVKEYIGRVRPNNDLAMIVLGRILQAPEGYSFFSGHAASSFSIAALAVLLLKGRFKWIYWVFFWPILISFSRVYLGVHYLLDVIVGAFVGVMFAYGVNALLQRVIVHDLG
ncbi:MAG: phosphatase PAP2 family protein [Flavobacteriales bacterium]|nr:MAG: phosphatase PAP2 family protein [Flavobacteriales bacterium]